MEDFEERSGSDAEEDASEPSSDDSDEEQPASGQGRAGQG